MSHWFQETRRQLAGIRRIWTALLDMPATLILLIAGVLTAMAWKGGLLILLVEALPGWAQMIVVMPLFGSMLAVYALGGMATVSLAMSVAADIALAPVRELKRRA
jgi:hypothetical protein